MHAQIVQHVFCVMFWKVQIYCCGSTYDYLLLACNQLQLQASSYRHYLWEPMHLPSCQIDIIGLCQTSSFPGRMPGGALAAAQLLQGGHFVDDIIMYSIAI